MTRLPALGLRVVALEMAAVGPRPAAAQLYQPLAQRAFLTTGARDERAIWVNPAGLSRRLQASLGADLTAERVAGEVRLAQYGVSLASRTLGFGWKHDRYPGGSSSNTYAVGVGLGDDVLSAGFTHRWNQGGQGAWDIGLRGRATAGLDVSLLWRNIGSPIVRDSVYRDSFVPAAAWRLPGGRVLAGVEADVPGNLGSPREVRAGVVLTIVPRLAVSCRGAFSGSVARRGLVVTVELGDLPYRGTVAALLPSGGGLGAVGLAGALVGEMPGPQRR